MKMANQETPRIEPSTEAAIKLALWDLIEILQQLSECLMKKSKNFTKKVLWHFYLPPMYITYFSQMYMEHSPMQAYFILLNFIFLHFIDVIFFLN